MDEVNSNKNNTRSNEKQINEIQSSIITSIDDTLDLTISTINVNNSTNISNTKINTNTHHHATSQIGGKGTIRRRRIRKTHISNTSTTSTFSSINNFENKITNFTDKFKLNNYGDIESLTFVKDNGIVHTYDSVDLYANFNAGIYKFRIKTQQPTNFNKQKSPQIEQKQDNLPIKIKKHRSRIDNANEFLNELNNVDNINRADEIHKLIGSDAKIYLQNLIDNNKSRSYNKNNNNLSSLLSNNNNDKIIISTETVSKITTDSTPVITKESDIYKLNDKKLNKKNKNKIKNQSKSLANVENAQIITKSNSNNNNNNHKNINIGLEINQADMSDEYVRKNVNFLTSNGESLFNDTNVNINNGNLLFIMNIYFLHNIVY